MKDDDGKRFGCSLHIRCLLVFLKYIIVVFAFKNNAKLKWTIRVSKNKSLWVFNNVIAHLKVKFTLIEITLTLF